MIDAKLGDDGDLLPFNYFITGDPLVVQRAKIRLRTGRGEWVLDVTAGYPVLEWAETRGLPVETVIFLTKEDLEQIPGLLRLDPNGNFDSKSRLMQVTGKGYLESGTTFGIVVSPLDVFGNPTPTVDILEY